MWISLLNDFLLALGFTRGFFDLCVYLRMDGDDYTYVLVYVDDILIASPHLSIINDIKVEFGKRFSMSDMGPAEWILGM